MQPSQFRIGSVTYRSSAADSAKVRALASNFSYGHTKIPSRTLSLSLLFNIISPNRFLLPCPTPTLFLSESVVLSVSPCAKPSQNGGGVNCHLVNCGQPSDTEAYLKSILLVSARVSSLHTAIKSTRRRHFSAALHSTASEYFDDTQQVKSKPTRRLLSSFPRFRI